LEKEQQIILCIPGHWKDRSEIVRTVARTNLHEYLFAGIALLHIPTSETFEVEVCEPDSGMRGSFEVAGQGRLSESELTAVDQHSLVVYLIGKGGNMQNAERVMKAATAFLNAGGLGVKVETTGKAFNKDQWLRLSQSRDEGKFYTGYVILVSTETNSVYSCGLHNIGLSDVICDCSLPIEEALDLVEIFIYYLLVDKPTIKSGETFSKETGAQKFVIIEEECTIYRPDHLFFNSFGMYRLELCDS
jgi:hypothetical protein